MAERADKLIQDELMSEAFVFGTKKLKRIDPAIFDYIRLKKENIQSDGDKMMLVSYIHSKLDLIDYYLSILSSPVLSKKYIVSESMEDLKVMRESLTVLKNDIINYRIPQRVKGMYIAWPDKYYG